MSARTKWSLCLLAFGVLGPVMGTALLKAFDSPLGLLFIATGMFSLVLWPFALDAGAFHWNYPTVESPVEPKETVIRHEIRQYTYHQNISRITEGKEISREMPDGSRYALRHVRRWE